MTNNQKILALISIQLRALGWDYVNNEYSGIFFKNGITFVTVFGSVDSERRYTQYEPKLKIMPCCDRAINPKQVSWFCEKDGYLLAKGKIPTQIANRYDENESNLESVPLLSFVEEAEELCRKDQHDLCAIKQMEVKKVTQVSKTVVQHSDARLRDTRLFRFSEGENQWGDVQYLVDFVMSEDQKVLVLFAKANASYLGPSKGQQMTIEVDVLSNLITEGKAEVVQAVEGQVDSVVYNWTSPFGGEGTVKLPEQFNTFGLTQECTKAVTTAFNEFLNYTDLLSPSVEDDLLDVYLKYLRAGLYIKDLIGKGFSAEQLEFLFEFRKKGYAINRIAKPTYSVSDMKLLLDDLQSSLMEEREQAIRAGASLESAGFIEAVATRQYGIYHLSAVDSKTMCALKDYSFRSNETKICEWLISNGQEFRDSEIIVSFWGQTPSDVKSALRAKFSSSIPLVVNGIDWNVFLDSVLRYAISYYFYKDCIYLNFSGYSLGRDANSFFIMQSADTRLMLWRAVCLNGEFYANKKNEADIFTL